MTKKRKPTRKGGTPTKEARDRAAMHGLIHKLVLLCERRTDEPDSEVISRTRWLNSRSHDARIADMRRALAYATEEYAPSWSDHIVAVKFLELVGFIPKLWWCRYELHCEDQSGKPYIKSKLMVMGKVELNDLELNRQFNEQRIDLVKSINHQHAIREHKWKLLVEPTTQAHLDKMTHKQRQEHESQLDEALARVC